MDKRRKNIYDIYKEFFIKFQNFGKRNKMLSKLIQIEGAFTIGFIEMRPKDFRFFYPNHIVSVKGFMKTFARNELEFISDHRNIPL